MPREDFERLYSQLGLRSRVLVRHYDPPIQKRPALKFDLDGGYFAFFVDEGDKISELRELGRIKVYEGGFPITLPYVEYTTTKDEVVLFCTTGDAGMRSVEDVLVNRIMAPYMEPADWRIEIDRRLKEIEKLAMNCEKPDAEFFKRMRNAEALFRTLFEDVAIVSLLEEYLDEYKERRQRVEDAIVRIAEDTLVVYSGLANQTRRILRRYVNLDPVGIDIDSVVSDIALLTNIVLVDGYTARINNQPKKIPRQITAQTGLVFNTLELEFCRPPFPQK